MTKKKLQGYVSSRPFQGERIPQHVQNITIRDYCLRNNFEYLLSATEYSMKNSYKILNQVLKDFKGINGLVCFSLFQLPEEDILRKKIYKKLINSKKTIHFALEDEKISNQNEVENIENIWKVKKTLNHCLKDYRV